MGLMTRHPQAPAGYPQGPAGGCDRCGSPRDTSKTASVTPPATLGKPVTTVTPAETRADASRETKIVTDVTGVTRSPYCGAIRARTHARDSYQTRKTCHPSHPSRPAPGRPA